MRQIGMLFLHTRFSNPDPPRLGFGLSPEGEGKRHPQDLQKLTASYYKYTAFVLPPSIQCKGHFSYEQPVVFQSLSGCTSACLHKRDDIMGQGRYNFALTS